MLALTNVAIANCFHLEYASLLGELVAETRREREREVSARETRCCCEWQVQRKTTLILQGGED